MIHPLQMQCCGGIWTSQNLFRYFLSGQIPTWPDICDTGIYHEVDLNMLVQEVVVDPSAPDWFLDLVSSVSVRYDLRVPIAKSYLAASPMWFSRNRISEVSPQETE